MINLFTTLIFLGIVYWLVYKSTAVYIPAWEERGFDKVGNSWDMVYGISALFGFLSAGIAWSETQNPSFTAVQSLYLTLAFGIAGFFLWFSGHTDAYTMKAPAEIIDLGLLLSFVLGGTGLVTGAMPQRYFDNASILSMIGDFWTLIFNSTPPNALLLPGSNELNPWIELGVWLIFPIIALFFAGGIGDGDLIAFAIVGFLFAPILGDLQMGWLLLLTVVIQLLLIIFLVLVKYKGVRKPTGFLAYRRKVNARFQRVFKTDKLLLKYDGFATPLLPAIALAFVVGGLILI